MDPVFFIFTAECIIMDNLSWYAAQYDDSLFIEDQHFSNADYRKKVRSVESFVLQRREVMDRFLASDQP